MHDCLTCTRFLLLNVSKKLEHHNFELKKKKNCTWTNAILNGWQLRCTMSYWKIHKLLYIVNWNCVIIFPLFHIPTTNLTINLCICNWNIYMWRSWHGLHVFYTLLYFFFWVILRSPNYDIAHHHTLGTIWKPLMSTMQWGEFNVLMFKPTM
jgi:hypothetical protein